MSKSKSKKRNPIYTKISNLNKTSTTGDFKFRVAGSKSKLYKEYDALLSGELSRSGAKEIVFFGKKGTPSTSHSLVTGKEFIKALKTMPKVVKEIGIMARKSRAKAVEEGMKSFLRHRDEIEWETSSSSKTFKDKVKRAYKYQIQKELNKEEYMDKFSKMHPKDSYDIIKDYHDIEYDEWKGFNPTYRKEVLKEMMIGVRKDGTIWYYGDSV